MMAKEQSHSPGSGSDHAPDDAMDASSQAESGAEFLELEVPEEVLRHLDEARQECERLREQAARARADYANLNRRSEEAIGRARDEGANEVFRRLLPVLDDLDRALAQASPAAAEGGLAAGVRLIREELRRIGDIMGLREVRPSRGTEFDANAHQALIRQAAPGQPPGTVVEVMQVGYERGGTVLRPAAVSVAAPPDDSQDECCDG